MASATVPSPSGSALADSTSVALPRSTAATIASASSTNSAFLATKSVSEPNWISDEPVAATRPLLAERSLRLAALAAPETRSSSTARSKSPSASVRAYFASIMPAPVWSRSFFTSAAVIAI